MEFAYKKLDVWQRAVAFAVRVIDAVEGISTDRKHYRLIEQIESCSSRIALKIAEGKGRFSKKEFVHFLYIWRGSLYEAMTLLEIFRLKKWISDGVYDVLEDEGVEIAGMIKGLINAVN
jgi:four helix bundle protein